MRLTLENAIRQSWLIHPDWDARTHEAWLEDEGYEFKVGEVQDILERLQRRDHAVEVERALTGAFGEVLAGADPIAVADALTRRV